MGELNIERLSEDPRDPRFVFKMKLMDEAKGQGANECWVYDEQQDVTTSASDESEADLGQMNSFIYSTQTQY